MRLQLYVLLIQRVLFCFTVAEKLFCHNLKTPLDNRLTLLSEVILFREINIAFLVVFQVKMYVCYFQTYSVVDLLKLTYFSFLSSMVIEQARVL